jgi:hypothetical protein
LTFWLIKVIITVQRIPNFRECTLPKKIAVDELPDEALRDLILLHVRRSCHCASSAYTNVPQTIADHLSNRSKATDALVARVRNLLLALKNESVVELGTRGGRIFEVRSPSTAEQAASPDQTSQPKPVPKPGPPSAAAKPAAAAQAAPHLPPRTATFRLLLRLWLIENGGCYADDHGLVSTAFRARFDLPSSTNTYITDALNAMSGVGEVYRQRTKDPAEQQTDPDKWRRSRRTYKVELRGKPVPGERETLEADLPRLLAIVLNQPQPAQGEAVPPVEPEPPAEPAAEPTPLDDVLIAQPEQLAQLADEMWELITRAHEALLAAASKPEVPSKGTWRVINGSATLREAGFTKPDAIKARWYLRLLGTRPVAQTAGPLWYWSVTPNPPTKEVVRKLIVDQRRIFELTSSAPDESRVAGPPASPVHVQGVPSTLPDSHVGAVRASGTTTVAPAGDPGPVTEEASSAEAPEGPAEAAAEAESVVLRVSLFDEDDDPDDATDETAALEQSAQVEPEPGSAPEPGTDALDSPELLDGLLKVIQDLEKENDGLRTENQSLRSQLTARATAQRAVAARALDAIRRHSPADD